MNKFLYRPWGIGILTACLIGLDQWTKYLAVKFLKGQEPFVIWDGVFEFHYLENRGAAFGMLQGKQAFFIIIGIVVFALSIYLFRNMSKDKKFIPIRLLIITILAGAWGNMIDRIWHAYVVDFLYFKLIDFPIFNVADIYVSVATVIFMVLILFYYKDDDFNRMIERKQREKL